MLYRTITIVMARRPPAKEVYVEEMTDSGVRYAVEGVVVDFDPRTGEGKLDDGTGVLKIILENFLFAEDLSVGSFVRVIGRGYLSEEGRVMRVEIVNPLNVPPDVYRRVKELERRVVT